MNPHAYLDGLKRWNIYNPAAQLFEITDQVVF
jgi:hypothetical protein